MIVRLIKPNNQLESESQWSPLETASSPSPRVPTTQRGPTPEQETTPGVKREPKNKTCPTYQQIYINLSKMPAQYFHVNKLFSSLIRLHALCLAICPSSMWNVGCDMTKWVCLCPQDSTYPSKVLFNHRRHTRNTVSVCGICNLKMSSIQKPGQCETDNQELYIYWLKLPQRRAD